jgi:hypothetical protein
MNIGADDLGPLSDRHFRQVCGVSLLLVGEHHTPGGRTDIAHPLGLTSQRHEIVVTPAVDLDEKAPAWDSGSSTRDLEFDDVARGHPEFAEDRRDRLQTAVEAGGRRYRVRAAYSTGPKKPSGSQRWCWVMIGSTFLSEE